MITPKIDALCHCLSYLTFKCRPHLIVRRVKHCSDWRVLLFSKKRYALKEEKRRKQQLKLQLIPIRLAAITGCNGVIAEDNEWAMCRNMNWKATGEANSHFERVSMWKFKFSRWEFREVQTRSLIRQIVQHSQHSHPFSWPSPQLQLKREKRDNCLSSDFSTKHSTFPSASVSLLFALKTFRR